MRNPFRRNKPLSLAQLQHQREAAKQKRPGRKAESKPKEMRNAGAWFREEWYSSPQAFEHVVQLRNELQDVGIQLRPARMGQVKNGYWWALDQIGGPASPRFYTLAEVQAELLIAQAQQAKKG